MPNARTHDLITIVTGAAAAPAVLNLNLPDMNPTTATILLGSYLASGLLFSPDLDLRSAPYRRWRGLRWIWLPYQWFVPHRSWISHSFLFGPLLRVLYFAIVMGLLTAGVLAVLLLFTAVDPTGTLPGLAAEALRWVDRHPSAIAYAGAGFVLGGAAHSLADIVFSAAKRVF